MKKHWTPGWWLLEQPGRPMTMNEYRRLHHMVRARYDRDVREEFNWLARLAGVPKGLERITIEAIPIVKRRPFPDTGACFPAVKAAIDGLVDVGMIPNDTPDHLNAITFHAPRIGEVDALRLIVRDGSDSLEPARAAS